MLFVRWMVRYRWWLGCCLGIGLVHGGLLKEAHAKDTRLAVLVGNEQGWHGDPRLNYALKGDVYPLARALRRAGFQVQIVSNRSAQALRRVLQQILRRAPQQPRVTTFFFFYSGHADKTYFHLGPKGKKPFSFREFARFLDKLPVQRRFTIIDACFSGELIRQFGNLERYRHLLSRRMIGKGVFKRLERRDLSQHFSNRGESARGLEILSSSRQLAFESQSRRASVFTYHLLQGLKGKADLDKDGKISFNELYLYAKPLVRRETGQNPQQWLFRVGSETYGFAPVYRGRMKISAAVTGQLTIAVGNFYWNHHKTKKHPIRLALLSGKGRLLLKRGSRCWRRSLHIPARKEIVLSMEGWKKASCRVAHLASKGSVEVPLDEYPPWRPEQLWSLEIRSGAWLSNGSLRSPRDFAGSVSVGARFRYFSAALGLWGTALPFQINEPAFRHLGISIRLEGGYRKRWYFFDLFVGAYLSGNILLQESQNESTATSLRPGFLFHGGVTVTPSFWFSSEWAVLLTVDVGPLPSLQGQSIQVFWRGAVSLGIRYSPDIRMFQ